MMIEERNVEEIITREELEEALRSKSKNKKKLRAYVGYEPSGSVHIGHLPIIDKLIELQRIGFHIIVLLADIHAYLNEKGSFELIRETAEYNKKCFAAMGLSEDTEFIFGSSFQMEEEYMMNVLRLATVTTLKRAKRSMDEISRSKEDSKVSQTIYPLMQAIDIAYLNIDVAIGGMDQRKIHMLSRENLPKLGFKAPICIHTPLLIGLDGEKMSSSKNNYISVEEEEESVGKKIKDAFCPPGIAESNPLLQMYKYIIFPKFGLVEVEREERYGGYISYDSYDKMERDFISDKLHPLDVKTNAIRYLNEIIGPIRNRLSL